jgi:hypothetical protein
VQTPSLQNQQNTYKTWTWRAFLGAIAMGLLAFSAVYPCSAWGDGELEDALEVSKKDAAFFESFFEVAVRSLEAPEEYRVNAALLRTNPGSSKVFPLVLDYLQHASLRHRSWEKMGDTVERMLQVVRLAGWESHPALQEGLRSFVFDYSLASRVTPVEFLRTVGSHSKAFSLGLTVGSMFLFGGLASKVIRISETSDRLKSAALEILLTTDFPLEKKIDLALEASERFDGAVGKLGGGFLIDHIEAISPDHEAKFLAILQTRRRFNKGFLESLGMGNPAYAHLNDLTSAGLRLELQRIAIMNTTEKSDFPNVPTTLWKTAVDGSREKIEGSLILKDPGKWFPLYFGAGLGIGVLSLNLADRLFPGAGGNPGLFFAMPGAMGALGLYARDYFNFFRPVFQAETGERYPLSRSNPLFHSLQNALGLSRAFETPDGSLRRVIPYRFHLEVDQEGEWTDVAADVVSPVKGSEDSHPQYKSVPLNKLLPCWERFRTLEKPVVHEKWDM